MKPRHATQLFEVNAKSDQHKTFEGRDHLVVPVVAVRESVLNGMLLLFDEFSAYPQAWEGIPLPVSHPLKDGLPVTANSPDILETSVIGRFFNVIADEATRSLKGEIWIDTEKAKTHADGPLIIERLTNGEKLEVSTAYFSDLEDKSGMFKGTSYNGVQRNLRPDHLALLPHSTGACSWDDGCGAPRFNQNRAQSLIIESNRLPKVTFTLTKNVEYSWSDMEAMIREALDALDASKYHWLADVYDDYVIYESTSRSTDSSANGLFKRSYSIMDGKVTFGDPTPVVRQTSYVEVNEETQMDKIKAIVDALIANDKTPWKETHREMLTALSECELKGLQPEVAPPPVVNMPPAPVVNTAPVAPKTTAEWLATVPAELQTVILGGLATHNSRKADLVAAITANKGCAFTKPELEGMELAFLEKVANTLDISYEGAAPPRVNRARPTENEEDIPLPPQILTAPVTKQ